MDIVVTTPKKELANVAKEEDFVKENKDAVQFWILNRKPKKLEIGDCVYFIHNGFIINYQEVIDFNKNMHCDVTGRTFTGVAVVLKCPAIKLDKLVPMQGFQGFRYLDEDSKRFLGLD